MTASAESEQREKQLVNEGRDIAYERREWVAQRVAWVVMLLLVVAAILGLLGSSGLLGMASSTAPDGSIEVIRERVGRYHAPTELIIEVSPGAIEQGEVRVWLDADYADGLTIDSIMPEPESSELEPGRIVYTFPVSEPGAPLRITLHYEHDTYWRSEAEMGLVNGETVSFTHIVLP
jgi:hypothetical protein